MELKYAVVNQPVIGIWEKPQEIMEGNQGNAVSSMADEGLYGMGLALTGALENGFYPVRTFYGYTGYVRENDIQIVSLQELKGWEEGGLMVTDGFLTDLLSIPRVQGVRLRSLFRGSLVRALDFNSEAEGWAYVELLNGRRGYVLNQYLRKKEFSQAGLWTGALVQKKIVDESLFRREVVETAKQYLGIQYRWGGRSTAGIDCSGLTSESYMLSGIFTYRDAKIEPGYPVHEIPKEEMLPGDLMYFPGHIAMYMGKGKYIHSTGKPGNSGVVINSLNPKEADYRPDLANVWYASGSIF